MFRIVSFQLTFQLTTRKKLKIVENQAAEIYKIITKIIMKLHLLFISRFNQTVVTEFRIPFLISFVDRNSRKKV